eukprot:11094558-Alexandrium_andersonii.AAC.1
MARGNSLRPGLGDACQVPLCPNLTPSVETLGTPGSKGAWSLCSEHACKGHEPSVALKVPERDRVGANTIVRCSLAEACLWGRRHQGNALSAPPTMGRFKG